jgi:beta-phosphoglucomutase
MPTDFAAVIFDFDGVLVHSEPLHEWAIRESVRALGWDFSTERFYAEIVGRGDENAYRLIAAWNGGEMAEGGLRDLLVAKWDLRDRGIEENRFHVQPGAVEAVRAAAARGPVGVCSGSVRRTVVPLLRRIGVLETLGTVVCGDDVPNMKPAPDGYLLAARRLGVEPSRCLAIEDTPSGISAAKSAGVHVVAVCHTMGAEKLGEAHRVVQRIGDINLNAGGAVPG